MVLTGGWFMALFYPHYELFHPELLLHQGYRWHQPCLSFVRLLAIMRSSATTSERKKNFGTSGQYPKKTWGKKKSLETCAVRASVSNNPTSFQTRHCGNSLGAEPTNLAWKCPLSDLHPSSQRDPPFRPQKNRSCLFKVKLVYVSKKYNIFHHIKSYLIYQISICKENRYQIYFYHLLSLIINLPNVYIKSKV